MERRLAAILAADVAGYSRLMGEDEAGTLAALRAHHSELIVPAIDKHRGRVVKLMGDGVLAEFGSVVEAVLCAAEIQQEIAERPCRTGSWPNPTTFMGRWSDRFVSPFIKFAQMPTTVTCSM